MKIAVIDNYDSFVYNLVRYLEEIEEVECVLQRNDQLNFAEIDQCDALLLSPGPGVPKQAGDLMKCIENYHQKKPILGVCLGHQAIGEFFGTKVIQSSEIMHGKKSLVHHKSETQLFKSIPPLFEVGRYHSWILSNELSSALEQTAEDEKGNVMAVRHKKLPINGVQFHPESILTPQGRTIVKNWVQSIQSN